MFNNHLINCNENLIHTLVSLSRWLTVTMAILWRFILVRLTFLLCNIVAHSVSDFMLLHAAAEHPAETEPSCKMSFHHIQNFSNGFVSLCWSRSSMHTQGQGTEAATMNVQLLFFHAGQHETNHWAHWGIKCVWKPVFALTLSTQRALSLWRAVWFLIQEVSPLSPINLSFMVWHIWWVLTASRSGLD